MSSAEQTAAERALSARPVWVATQPNPALAFLHLPPDPGTARPTAVLFCPPFGWEEMCSYRGRRAWAQTLAQAGYPAARFNLPGTGDSAGSPRDPGQLEAWTAAVATAAEWLADSTGAERVTAIGIGLGGMLACRAIAAGARIDDLILWSVPADGRAWLRELRAYAEIVAARRPEDHGPGANGDGDVEYIGFVLTAETARAVEGLRLTDLGLPDNAGRRVLLLGRDGLPPDRRLREHFARAGAAVTAQDTDDYAALMTHPQESEVPRATIEKTLTWLSAGTPAPERRSDRASGERARTVERASLELPFAQTTIRETPIAFEGPAGEMFGVLCESAELDPAPVCGVWLNGGALRHTGPNRAWVDVSRRWATRGVPTVRVDLQGIGDSEGEEGYVANPYLYTPERTRETLTIIDQLADRGIGNRFVLGGLCSGAYWSLHAALADPRVAGALMINLYAFFWSEALVAERETRDSLSALRGYGWRRLVRRDLTLRHVRLVLGSLSPTRLRAGAGHPVERAQSDEIERALDKLRDQRTHALLLLSRGEGLRDQLARQGVPGRLERWPNLALEEIPSTDHMFRALWLQRHVHGALDRALDRVLAEASG